jgi:3-hydroxyisobutyrate dehydrogenase-like beta-hydroxyacid dehydrogenase
MSNDHTIGFIGLGQMGLGMACNLISAGYDVLGYDVAEQPMERLVAKGGRRSRDVAQIGRECQRILVMVVSGDQVASVVCGDGGLLKTMKGGVIMVCSTIALSEFQPVAEQAAACGIEVIDCPVSGGEKGAVEGTLTILCGGDETIVASQRPLLDLLGSNVVYMGPSGAGLIGKLANNLIINVNRLAIAEAMAMAKKAGVSLEVLHRTLITCSADSRILRNLKAPILRGEYPTMTFHGLKDITAAADSGRAVKQAMPVTNLCREIYQLADDKLGGLCGSSEVLRYFLEN